MAQLVLSKGQRAKLDCQDLKLSTQGTDDARDTLRTMGWWPSRCRGKLPKSKMGEQVEGGTSDTDAEIRKGTGQDDKRKL